MEWDLRRQWSLIHHDTNGRREGLESGLDWAVVMMGDEVMGD